MNYRVPPRNLGFSPFADVLLSGRIDYEVSATRLYFFPHSFILFPLSVF